MHERFTTDNGRVLHTIRSLTDTLRERDRSQKNLELAEIYKTQEQALQIEQQSTSILICANDIHTATPSRSDRGSDSGTDTDSQDKDPDNTGGGTDTPPAPAPTPYLYGRYGPKTPHASSAANSPPRAAAPHASSHATAPNTPNPDRFYAGEDTQLDRAAAFIHSGR